MSLDPLRCRHQPGKLVGWEGAALGPAVRTTLAQASQRRRLIRLAPVLIAFQISLAWPTRVIAAHGRVQRRRGLRPRTQVVARAQLLPKRSALATALGGVLATALGGVYRGAEQQEQREWRGGSHAERGARLRGDLQPGGKWTAELATT